MMSCVGKLVHLAIHQIRDHLLGGDDGGCPDLVEVEVVVPPSVGGGDLTPGQARYAFAKAVKVANGIDGVTFDAAAQTADWPTSHDDQFTRVGPLNWVAGTGFEPV